MYDLEVWQISISFEFSARTICFVCSDIIVFTQICFCISWDNNDIDKVIKDNTNVLKSKCQLFFQTNSLLKACLLFVKINNIFNIFCDIIHVHDEECRPKYCTLGDSGFHFCRDGLVAINNYLLCSVCKEGFYSGKDFSSDLHLFKFMEQYLVIDLVKSFWQV